MGFAVFSMWRNCLNFVIYVGVVMLMDHPVTAQTCPSGTFSGTTYSIIEITPFAAVFLVTVSPTTSTNNGWSAAVMFSSRLENDVSIESYSTTPVIGASGEIVTFTGKDYWKDLSNLQQFQFTFFIKSTATNLLTTRTDYTALVVFFDSAVLDASCLLDPNVVEPLPTTTTESTTSTATISTASTTTSSTTTTITTSTTTTAPTTTTSVASTTSTPSVDGGLPSGTTVVPYEVINPGWNNGGKWTFQFKYDSPSAGSYEDWTLKIVFSKEVTLITPYEANPDGPYSGGLVWFLRPKSWNFNTAHVVGSAQADTTGEAAATATIVLYNNGAVPDTSTSNGGGSSTTSSTTTSSTTTTVSSASTSTLDPNAVTGTLPSTAQQTAPNFSSSTDVDAENPYDYNEILHKSLLFYEAQRSGDLPDSNRIPWRGDSGLKDGCVGSTCYADLVGGWYDAGDHVKFGFPMAWATTVLAWGMIEFEEAYKDAGEWQNALNCIKWTADYFVKAHVSPNELYFQVGDPDADHAAWGHPETMDMDRPIYKIDSNKPGTEVAAETAAALAATSIVFMEEGDTEYAETLLKHAVELYDFAHTYRGNYHESVPESKVGNFYKSWSGYTDELMWAAMWLYKATGSTEFLNDAVQLVDSVGYSEFSWDLKGPGALVLLSQEISMYRTRLFAAIDDVRNKGTTPAGLTYFSPWGTNRYAANYALIALVTAKMEGITSSASVLYHDYAKNQISYMLGSGDGSRSYVVGFGNNPPQQPHHRSSSCRLWTSDPATQDCNYQDRDASGPNPLILYGALVGGPGEDGSYVDVRSDYTKNEVAVDYNAGFQSAVAGLKYFQMV